MQFTQLNQISCIADNIVAGDAVPVGGNMFSGKYDTFINIAPDKFSHFFEVADRNIKKMLANKEPIQKWLTQSATQDFDIDTFIHLWVFDNALRALYPNMSTNRSQRIKTYSEVGTMELSQSFNARICECAEIALLAQLYCQRYNIRTEYFGGELLTTNKNINENGEDYGEAHSFIFLHTNGQTYIYDPANPIISSGKYVPRIHIATPTQMAQFNERTHDNSRRNCVFMETKNLFTGQIWLYGCGDGAVIWPQNIIRTPQAAPTQQKEY